MLSFIQRGIILKCLLGQSYFTLTDLSEKEPHRQVGVERVIASRLFFVLLLFYAIATVFQLYLYLGCDMMYVR